MPGRVGPRALFGLQGGKQLATPVAEMWVPGTAPGAAAGTQTYKAASHVDAQGSLLQQGPVRCDARNWCAPHSEVCDGCGQKPWNRRAQHGAS